MGHSAEYRKHADECRRMAELNRHSENREVWVRLADRWTHCAEMEEGRRPPFGHAFRIASQASPESGSRAD